MRRVVDDLASALADDLGRGDASDATEAWQLADRALFFEYLAACRESRRHRDTAAECAHRAVEKLASDDSSPATVFAGWLAVAWVFEHLQRAFPGHSDRVRECGDRLAGRSMDLLRTEEWTGPFDLFKGLVGFGVHALERGARGGDQVRCVIDHLADLAELDDEERFAAFWTSPEHAGPRGSSPHGQYNLGLAHGTPGVVAFLSAALAADIAAEQSRSLLQKTVAWLRDLNGQFGPSGFPAVIVTGERFFRSDASWAYGDAGVAMAILSAARVLGDPSAEADALAIARRSLLRPLDDYLGPHRPCISHGAAGLTQIHGRLYQATNDPAYLQAAGQWCQRILDHWQAPVGRGIGFPEIHGQLFGGAVGIGLVLLAASEELEPQWDRLLLLSM